MIQYRVLQSPSAKAPCIVYDFGIREQPEFGKMMATKYGEQPQLPHTTQLNRMQAVRCMPLIRLQSASSSTELTASCRNCQTIISTSMVPGGATVRACGLRVCG